MRIAVLEPLGTVREDIERIAEPLYKKGFEITIYENRTADKMELVSRVKDADVLVLANMPLSGEVIRSTSNLKMISVAFTGVDHIGLDECRDMGITVCNAAGYSTSSVAELTYGLIISVLRNIVPLDSAARHGGTKLGFTQNELYGKTMGIIGTGAIGNRVAEIAKAFGCRVAACSRSVKQSILDMEIKYVSLEELMSTSDIVSVHVPLTEETKGMINSRLISLMKPSSVFINTSRGGVVDYGALTQALKSGKIAGAGIDVFETEPPISKDHPLMDAPNTVLTPHIGFAAEEAIYRRTQITFDNILEWADGNPQNVVL